MSQSHSVQSWVLRELDSCLGGEKTIFAMLYTHVRCLQVMYVRSCLHVCTTMLLPRVNAYYDNVRANPLIARENMTRCDSTRRGVPSFSPFRAHFGNEQSAHRYEWYSDGKKVHFATRSRGLMGLDGTRAEPLVVSLTTCGRNVTIPAGGGYEDLVFLFPHRNSPKSFCFPCEPTDRAEGPACQRGANCREFFGVRLVRYVLRWHDTWRGTIIPGLLRRIPSELRS